MYCIGTNKLEKRNLKVELEFSIHKSFILFSVSSDYVSKHNLQGRNQQFFLAKRTLLSNDYQSSRWRHKILYCVGDK